jgi:hypothetical protein
MVRRTFPENELEMRFKSFTASGRERFVLLPRSVGISLANIPSLTFVLSKSSPGQQGPWPPFGVAENR